LLTDLAIRKLKLPAARVEVRDGGAKGLYLIVQPSGARSWAFRYAVNRRPRKLTLGPYPELDIIEARAKAMAAAVDVSHGRDPAGDKRAARMAAAVPVAKRVAVADVAAEFLKRHARENNSPRWAREVERLLKREVLPFIGAKAMDSISKRDIHELVDRVKDRGAEVQANRLLAVLKRMFRWSLGRDFINVNPTAGVEWPTREESRERVLTDKELAAIWRAAGEIGYPHGSAVWLMILTGQRREEVARMEWGEVDFGRGEWTLSAGRTKNKREHVVPLSDAAIDILQQIDRVGPFVFSSSGATAINGWGRAKERLDELSGVEKWVLHDLRRTFVTGVAGLKAPAVEPHVIEALVNHRTGVIRGVAKVYNRYSYLPEKRAAMSAWARRVGEIVG